MIDAFRSRLAGAVQNISRVALRRAWVPARSEYLGSSVEASTAPDVLLNGMFGTRASTECPPELPELKAQQFSALWQIDPGAQQLLREFVRLARPKRFFETGVADGASTRIILDALEKNGDGRLVSVDISTEVGSLARQSPAVHRWQLVVLPARGRTTVFRDAVRRAAPLDAFLHDSDHRYPWQMFEYREAWAALSPGGWLLSDDIDSSYAFLDFSRRLHLRPWVLVGPRKLFGVVRKPT